MLFIKDSKNAWWELNKENMTVSSFDGGFHSITEQELESSETVECDGWHELYIIKR